jgi:hypothetical protein
MREMRNEEFGIMIVFTGIIVVAQDAWQLEFL